MNKITAMTMSILICVCRKESVYYAHVYSRSVGQGF